MTISDETPDVVVISDLPDLDRATEQWAIAAGWREQLSLLIQITEGVAGNRISGAGGSELRMMILKQRALIDRWVRQAFQEGLLARQSADERVAELEELFDLEWNADMRAVKMWREANPGNDLVLPDHARMVVWLIERLDARRGVEAISEPMTTPLTTAEIVERLRKGVPYWTPPSAYMDTPDVSAADALMDEAASALLALEGERDEARAANEFDRTTIIDARNAIHDEIVRRSWILEGRGSYEWDDDRYRDEFKAALDAIGKPLEILHKLGINWAHCPTDSKEIAAARIDYRRRAEAAEAELAKVRTALEPFGDIDGEGDEDFPDDTPVIITFGRSKVYTVTLGDFRRARAALSGSTV